MKTTHSIALPTASIDDAAPAIGVGKVRWSICVLLLLATTINYMDRQVIGILKPTLQEKLKWNEEEYGHIVSLFQLAYAFGQLGGGRLMDLIGVRLGYLLAVIGWSLSAVGHGWARTVGQFSTARVGLGLTEGGNFPGAIKTVGQWFPKKERALATGIFNSGSNLGALVTPLAVPWLAYHWGWQSAFFWTGSMGFAWAFLWLLFYRDPQHHPALSDSERAYIESDQDEKTGHVQEMEKWSAVLSRRATWAYIAGAVFTAPVWWFYLFWVPDFLHKKHGLDLSHIGLPVATIYFLAGFGSIAGGWCSSHLIGRGWSIDAARKITFLICGLIVVPVFFASVVSHLWIAVLLIGLAAAAHQGFSANLYTFVSDTNPKRSISTVCGIGGLAGGLVGSVVAEAVGFILQKSHGNYFLLFAAASVMYLIALLIIHLLVPKISQGEASSL